MKGRGLRALGFLLIASLIATGFAAAKVQSGGGRASRTLAASGCQLNSVGGKIKHVVYLQFDNTHYTRDNPSVASDLEQMPHPAQFPQGERDAVHERPHDPDLAHRGRDPVHPNRSLPGSARDQCLEQLLLLPAEQDSGVQHCVQVLDRPGRRLDRRQRSSAEHGHGSEDNPGAVGSIHTSGLRLRCDLAREHRAREHRHGPIWRHVAGIRDRLA